MANDVKMAIEWGRTWGDADHVRLADLLARESERADRAERRLYRLANGCRVRRVHEDWPALEPFITQALEQTSPEVDDG